MCTYSFRHIQWQAIATFLLRGGSRNAFDADRNSGVSVSPTASSF
jgi:hypothetical protein